MMHDPTARIARRRDRPLLCAAAGSGRSRWSAAGAGVLVLRRRQGAKRPSTAGARARPRPAASIPAARRRIGGFPFRIEVRCDRRRRAVPQQRSRRSSSRPADILVAAQVYQPTLLISEFTGPLTIAEPGKPPSYRRQLEAGAVERARHAGRAGARVARVRRAGGRPRQRRRAARTCCKAKRIEIHGRIVEGSAADNPVIEIVLQLDAGRRRRRCIRPRRSRSMPTSPRCCAA